MTGALPWMKLFPAEFLTQTAGWPPEAVGAFVRLICVSWAQSGLVDDDRALRVITGLSSQQWSRVWPRLEVHFPLCDDGRRRNPELEARRAEGLDLYARRRDASRKANSARWGHASGSDSVSVSDSDSVSDPISESELELEYSCRSPAPAGKAAPC